MNKRKIPKIKIVPIKPMKVNFGMDKLFTKINDYAYVCKKCKTTSFRLHPTGEVQCESCGAEYCYSNMTKEWAHVTRSNKTRKREHRRKEKKNKDNDNEQKAC